MGEGVEGLRLLSPAKEEPSEDTAGDGDDVSDELDEAYCESGEHRCWWGGRGKWSGIGIITEPNRSEAGLEARYIFPSILLLS